MLSLRGFHQVFILIAIVATDMIGAWAIWKHALTGNPAMLVAGVLSFLAGFALIGYVIWVVRKLDRDARAEQAARQTA